MDISTLTEEFQTHKQQYPEAFRLRIHRALSWLKKADQCADDDMRFITLWIAFNAAYAKEIEAAAVTGTPDRARFHEFLQIIASLDQEQRLYRLIWEQFSDHLRLLLDNRYVFQPFWDFHNGRIAETVWQEAFVRAKQKTNRALADKDTVLILGVVFDRLYTLRNQIMHGGATYHSSANRKQLRDGCAFLSACVPLIIGLMLQYPQHPAWGKPFYPFVREE